MKILITGAAGNLGSFLARYLLPTGHPLHLLTHQKALPYAVENYPNATVFQGDLGQPETLLPACQGVVCIVHFAGVLFAPFPERFLPVTNLGYVQNLIAAAQAARVSKFILISFPHVEGESTPEQPARGRLDGNPVSVHARTRLAAEKHLFEQAAGTSMAPVVLRPGMIYGRGVLMIEAARWLMKRRLLGIWKEPTWIHLLSLPDFLACTVAAIEGEHVQGIYNLGDDKPMTLQAFLDTFANHCGYPRPWRAPRWLFPVAGRLTEVAAWLLYKPAPLTRDFIRIGMVSYTADTGRMKSELLAQLAYPDLRAGLELL
jgi:nucleoside-diphosphate-sugar epimerase